ncbi:MAG: hypothetical protein A3F72_12775 [Bacteroidetes bacterium RIFCSPLOWO2_12_FULL_35_15]|nr:MAG: hypothetical protein A3F72_12775 [Bacteroidetes bacterium RIFCSPLOWO2_12_FULL_35_15]
MKTTFLILTILFSLNVSGQFTGRITDYCNQKELKKLTSLLDSVSKIKNTDNFTYAASSGYPRQIIGKYDAVIMYYSEAFPKEPNSRIFNVYPLFIKLILNTNEIIFCQLTDECNLYHIDTVINYLDTIKFKEFQNSYFKQYEYQIDADSIFFNQEVVYGKRCGNGAQPPKYRVLCETAIKTQNLDLLNSWLRCPTIEKQAYAIEALIRLEEKGLILTDKQKQLIKIIKKKKERIIVCSGCRHYSKKIRRALRNP